MQQQSSVLFAEFCTRLLQGQLLPVPSLAASGTSDHLPHRRINSIIIKRKPSRHLEAGSSIGQQCSSIEPLRSQSHLLQIRQSATHRVLLMLKQPAVPTKGWPSLSSSVRRPQQVVGLRLVADQVEQQLQTTTGDPGNCRLLLLLLLI